MSVRRGVGVVLLAGLPALALVAAFRRPSPPPAPAPVLARTLGPDGLPLITPQELRARLDAGGEFLLVFVGTREFFRERRIPGARCIGYSELRSVFEGLDRDREIVLYCGCCGDASGGVSGLALRQLLAMGFRKASHLAGHFAGWQKAGLAVDGTNPEPPLERAYASAAQKQDLEDFVSSHRARRGELEAALRAESDPDRRAELTGRLEAFDREEEIRGLRLKRKLALESGDAAKAADIDRMLEIRSAGRLK